MSENLLKETKGPSRNYHRADFSRKVELYLGENTVLRGVSKDISTNSASMFVSYEGIESYLKQYRIKDPNQLSIQQWRKILADEKAMVSLQDISLPEPIDFRVLRIETSWEKGFDLFVAGRFENTDDFLTKEILQLCPELSGESSAPKKRYISEKLPIFREMMQEEGVSSFNVEYSNRYDHVHSFRDLLAGLAEKHGFSDEDAYMIKLMTDEVLMNAFLYGSIEEGKDKTSIEAFFSPRGILVEIVDYAGKYFDDHPFHFRKKLELKQLGGLVLVEAYSDDWQVDIVPGESTKVTFFKTLKQESA